MGWAGPMPNAQGRMVGYAVVASCDQYGCNTTIDRGLAYCCGGMHDGGDHGCGRYFCGQHIFMGIGLPEQMCESCADEYAAEHQVEIDASIAEFEESRRFIRDP